MRFQSRAVGGARATGQMRSSKKWNFMRSSKRGSVGVRRPGGPE